jgi:hypothetical protein
MAMIKSIFTFSIFLLFSIISNAQIFKIKALNGTSQQVRFSHEVGDQKLVITSLKDSLIIDDFIGLSEDISILNESFLCIHYNVRTGSDQSREMLLILCANNNKLCQALHILSLSTYDIVSMFDKKVDSLKLFDEHREYEVKINLIGIDQKHYKLNINIYDQSESKGNAKTNHNYNKLIILSFDDSIGIFYNAQKDLSKYFTVYDPKAQRTTKQFIMGTFPTIELNSTNYYYMHGEWYEEGYDDNLFKNTYK